MKDDETLGAFKEKVAAVLSKLFNKEIKKTDVDILHDGWYDG